MPAQIPTGAAAEAELRRIRRNQRRKERREAKRAAELAELGYTPDGLPIKGGPVDDSNISTKSAMPKDRVPTLDELKADLMGAFHELGGMAGMVAWGRRYPKEFYAMWAKYCLPDQKQEDTADETSLEAMLKKLDEQDHHTEH